MVFDFYFLVGGYWLGFWLAKSATLDEKFIWMFAETTG